MADPHPLVAEFITKVDRRFSTAELESFWDCEAIYRELLVGSFVHETVNETLRLLTRDHYHSGDWPQNQMMLHRGRGYALAIALFDTPRRYIHTTPFYGFYAPVSGEALHYDVYALPTGYDNAVFDPSLQLEHVSSEVLPSNEILRIRSDRFAYDFKIEQPLIVLKFTTAPFYTLEWLFSKESLRPWQANDADLSATQLRVAAYVLGRLSHQSSLAALKLIASHANPAVRWAGIQNLGRVSRVEALLHLKAAVKDSHPHIRRAAQKTLDQLDAKKTPR